MKWGTIRNRDFRFESQNNQNVSSDLMATMN